LQGEEVQLLLILDLGTRWGRVVSVTPAAIYRGVKAPPPPVSIVQKAEWGSGAILDTEARGKIRCLCRESNLDRSVQSVVRHYRLSYPTPVRKSLQSVNTCTFQINVNFCNKTVILHETFVTLLRHLHTSLTRQMGKKALRFSDSVRKWCLQSLATQHTRTLATLDSILDQENPVLSSTH
jgi:hypothetical protein